MDVFQYKMAIAKIDNLTTKKSKKELLTSMLYERDYYTFKALTYLLQKYPDDFTIGTNISNDIKKTLAFLLNKKMHDVTELTEFCNTDFTVTQVHLDGLIASRYTAYQMLAYAANHIEVK